MLVVKTKVKESSLGGLGLFADQNIKKGDCVWKFEPEIDIFFEPENVAKMEKNKQELIKTYAYLSPESKKYVYCIDNGRFMNHSSKINNVDVVKFPNETETRAVANRNIDMGEEILINYRQIDTADAESDESYLNN